MKRILFAGAGWGNGSYTISKINGYVKIIGWRVDPTRRILSKTVTVNICDVNESPSVKSVVASVDENRISTAVSLGQISVNDPEGSSDIDVSFDSSLFYTDNDLNIYVSFFSPLFFFNFSAPSNM